MSIGLSADELIQWGMSSYQETIGQVFKSINEDSDLNWLTNDPKEVQKMAMGEAVIRAVAVMIETNNAALDASLKHQGMMKNIREQRETT